MFETIEELVTHYRETLEGYRQFVENGLNGIRRKIGPDASNVVVHSRVKSPRSIIAKLCRSSRGRKYLRSKDLSLAPLVQLVPDLIGLRIVVRFSDLTTAALSYLSNHSELELAVGGPHPWINQRTAVQHYEWSDGGRETVRRMNLRVHANLPVPAVPRLRRDSGYASVHVLVRKKHTTALAEEPLLAEIQLRSAIDDVWAELQHPRYKDASNADGEAPIDVEFRHLSERLAAVGTRVAELRRRQMRETRSDVGTCYRLRSGVISGMGSGVDDALSAAYAAFEAWHKVFQETGEPDTELDDKLARSVQSVQRAMTNSKAPTDRDQLNDLQSDLAFLTLCAGDQATAYLLYYDVLDSSPHHFFANYRLSSIAFERGEFREAVQRMERAPQAYRPSLRDRYESIPPLTRVRTILVHYRYHLLQSRRDFLLADGLHGERRQLALDAKKIHLDSLSDEDASDKDRRMAANNYLYIAVQEATPAQRRELLNFASTNRLLELPEKMESTMRAAVLETLANLYGAMNRVEDAVRTAHEARCLARNSNLDRRDRLAVDQTFELLMKRWVQRRPKAPKRPKA